LRVASLDAVAIAEVASRRDSVIVRVRDGLKTKRTAVDTARANHHGTLTRRNEAVKLLLIATIVAVAETTRTDVVVTVLPIVMAQLAVLSEPETDTSVTTDCVAVPEQIN
jgi:hypothetical protein